MFKRWLVATWALTLVVACCWPASGGAAGDFSYATDTTYRVNAAGITSVEEHYQITNNTTRLYLSQIQISTPSDDISGVSASYDDGGSLAVSASEQSSGKAGGYKYQRLTITFNKQLYGQGKKWSFTLRYQTKGLVDSKGGSHVVYIPQIEPTDGTDRYDVTVVVPDSFGGAHFSGAKLASRGGAGGEQFFHFNQQELTKNSLALAFGDLNRYKLNFNFPLKNDSPFNRTMTIALPPNLNNQTVYVNSLNPKPARTRVDADGNTLADYNLGGGQSLLVKTDIVGEVRYRDYDQAKSGKRGDIPADLVRRYTGSTKYWQANGDVAKAAASVSKSNRPVIQNVHAMYQYVIDRLSYNNDKIAFNVRQGSSKAFANPSNSVCLEYSDLLIAMLRSQGIPARMPVGYGYTGNLKQSAAVADSLHSWVEAYVPGIGWMTLDPTWGEKFDDFGQSDLDHMAFSVWGSSDDRPAATMVDGVDAGYQYEQTELSYIYSTPPTPTGAKVSARRYPLLPWLALDEIVATGQSQVVISNAAVAVDSTNLDLGNLAPGETATRYRLYVGGGWLGAPNVQLLTSGNSLASARGRAQYASLVIVAALIALLVVLWRRWRHRTAKTLVTSSAGETKAETVAESGETLDR